MQLVELCFIYVEIYKSEVDFRDGFQRVKPSFGQKSSEKRNLKSAYLCNSGVS